MVSKNSNPTRQRPDRNGRGKPRRRRPDDRTPAGPLPGPGPIIDSGPLPDDILGGSFLGLDKDLPLLLLPVRIETRYVLDANPPELRIRVYPDQIHIDADRPQPSTREVKITQEFWRRWHAAKDEAKRKTTWQQFIQQAGAKRAGYLARIMRPTSGRNGDMVFPAIPIESTQTQPPHAASAASAALLPHRWLAIGYGVSGNQIFSRASLPVADNLRTGPDPEAPTWEMDGEGLEIDDGLAWMIDYQRAVQDGMAITVPLTGPAAEAIDQIQVLLVLGLVDGLDPLAASTELARLLEVHARTSGLAFVPQGTPTNNTEDAESGWTHTEEEVAAVLGERSFKDLPKAPSKVFDDNAAELARAFGFTDSAFLRHLAYGTDREAAASRNMRTVLFEAVAGTMLRQLLDLGAKNGLTDSAISTLRTWFIENVTGGAPLPTLRVGPQPYGILPVRRAVTAPDVSTTAGQVERIINLLIGVWRESLLNVPTLVEDPNAENPEEEIETAIASILANQPHPARIFTRQMDEYIEDETPMVIQNTYDWFIDTMFSADSPDDIREVGELYYTMSHDLYPNGVKNIDEQLDLWTKIYDRLDQLNNNNGRDFTEWLLGILESYEKRQRPLRWIGLDNYEGVLGNENTKIVAGALWGSTAEWDEDGLIQAADPPAGRSAAEYLSELKRRSETGETQLSNWSPKPLLYQLIELTLSLVPKQPGVRAKFQQALESLAGVEPAELDWLVRETLGLGSHRLDAWETSLATDRLNQMRGAKPNGIQIGAFGWVTPLRPRRGKRSSEGYIHAPSMAHASTAALLRAGYLAHGGSDSLSPAAVDIRSAQVRTASWLLDGVRQGQPLGDLLGYHFERSLHDRGADVDIQAVRQLVLTAQGKPKALPNQPVDGIELLDLYRGRQIPQTSFSAKAKEALADLELAFDAVYDVSLFESLHQLTAGNFDRATAMMDSVTTGTIDPPELRAPLTPRSAVAVEHRVVILLNTGAPAPNRGWNKGIRDTLSPALEGWVASLLPHAGQIGFQITEIQTDGLAGKSSPLTLQKLNLSALDAVFLAGDDPLAAAPAFVTLAAGAVGLPGAARIEPRLTDQDFSLADFTVLASELRRLLEALRPLDARDLRPSAQRGEPDTDYSTGQAAVTTLMNNFQILANKFTDPLVVLSPQETASTVSALARLGISVGASPLDPDCVEVLKQMVQRRSVNITRIEIDSANPLPGYESRLSTLLGRRVPVLGKFVLAGSAGGPVVNVTKSPAATAAVDDWLDAAGRVRADVGRLTALGMLSELMGSGGLVIQAGQDPLEAGEGWAAVTKPAGSGRLSVVAVSGPGGPPADGQPACGLFVDQWSEAVPVDQQVTGVTIQFDAPSNRPPQAWLLAVPPEGEPWSLKLVTDTLIQTMEWAALRAVGPEHLVDYGRAIPTTFVPGNILNWPVEDAA